MSTTVEAEVTGEGIVNDGNLNTAQAHTSRKGFCSVRHGLAFIMHFCNFSILTQQMNMSIAIPAMVNNTALPSLPNASTEKPPTESQDNWNETLKEFKVVAAMYDWSPEIQGIILSSLNFGSFLAPIPSVFLVELFGAKYLTGAGIFISSVLNLFIPLAADTGVTLLIVLRVIQGLVQVLALTCQYSIWARWAPPMERSQLTTIAQSGSVLGCFIIFLAGGHICQTIGWPYVFYIFGGTGCACSFLWILLIYDDPVNHPFISTSEKEYIIFSLAQEDSPPGWSLPIKDMLKSLPLWSILIFHFTDYWHFFLITMYTPIYINSVLQANIRDSGILSALPFASASIFIVLEGLLADFLLSRKILKLITIRKLFTTIGVLFPAALSVSLFWVRSSFSTTMVFLMLSSVIKSLIQSGAFVSFLDIAPRYSALLRGLTQIFSYMAGAISPTVAGFLIEQFNFQIQPETLRGTGKTFSFPIRAHRALWDWRGVLIFIWKSVEVVRNPLEELLELINELSKVSGYKININKSYFYIFAMNNSKIKLISFKVALKIYHNFFIQSSIDGH
ncbi:probable small intestine urate exporter isoform X2 [Camelus ferus]|uniref:Small intestine urate exporter isoform X3 n=2 Tax=Camelus TaxID=9836 RepID=A0AC58P2P1_CAMBA|nr:probable small intestine urate exporter isoform X2 [Camelus ferus]